jgi:excisionase family DNA binding protein
MSTEALLLKPKEAAQALAISPRTLWALTQSGEIRALRTGRILRYSVDTLRAWVASKLTVSQ